MSKKRKKVPLNNQPTPEPLLRQEFKPKTKNQYKYMKGIINNDVVFCIGPAGVGKSAVAVGVSVTALVSRKASKIVISRPIVEASYSQKRVVGILPGGVNEKLQPYVQPIYAELEKYLGIVKLKALLADKTIEVIPLELMRGLTFDDAIIILDECQNATYEQITMFITRIGKDSKAILNGDISQTDLPTFAQGGLEKYIDIAREVEGVEIIELDATDQQRNPVINRILAAKAEYDGRY